MITSNSTIANEENGRLLFILPQRIDNMPYSRNYFKVADQCGVGYDIVCWNRRGEVLDSCPNCTVYNHPTKNDYGALKKILEIFGFYRFVIKSVKNKNYKAVFTYTIADSILFTPWLTRKYRGKYVFDIRDYSPVIGFFPTRWMVKRLLRFSALNVISSEGFKQWLPKGFDYVLCHNTDIDKVSREVLKYESISDKGDSGFITYNPSSTGEVMTILTIGLLRDREANTHLIDSFANKNNIKLRFAGTGSAFFEQYCKEKAVDCFEVTDTYSKSEEDEIVSSSSIINLFLPHTLNSDTCMGNRMYLAARLRKPLIVTKNSYQAKVVEGYHMGVCVDWDDDLYQKIVDYWKTINWMQFDIGCHLFLTDVWHDMKTWQDVVKAIMLR